MQVEAVVLVPPGTPEARSRHMAEFPLERRVPPGYALDWERVALASIEPLAEIGERHTWRAIAVPVALTRREAPVSDLRPERRAVNRSAQSIHPLVEHRPHHC